MLRVSRCTIQSFSCRQSTCSFWSKNFHMLRRSYGGTTLVRPIATRAEQRTRDPKITETKTGPLNCFESIQYCDSQQKINEGQALKYLVHVFVIDIETTGLSSETGHIIEIAVRDLKGGKNSCFQTLVNPEQDVPNSFIHGITTRMVNQPHVPRMEDLLPILLSYIKRRLQPGCLALFAAHNARCFDVPFLIKEFNRCSHDIPSNWLFLDTLPIARELMKLNVPKTSTKTSLQALREYYKMLSVGSSHRAMSDVNLLTSILEKMIIDLKLTMTDLLERSFSASDLNKIKKNTKKGQC